MILLESRIEPSSQETSSVLWKPYFEGGILHTEVSENILSLQFQFLYDASGPLVQNNSPTKSVLDVVQSFNVVFSSDRSDDRFTGKPYSSSIGLY